MITPNTDITLHQDGMLRIEIAAIIMLLMALAIVLIMNVPPAYQPDIAQVGEPERTLPVVNADTGNLLAPQFQLQPAAGPKLDTL